MDTASDPVGKSKPVCQCAVQRRLPRLPIALCMLMSLSSVTVCLLMTLKTYELENRLQMEMSEASVFQPPRKAFLNEDGTLIPELATPIGQLVEKVHGAVKRGRRCIVCEPLTDALAHLCVTSA